MHKIQRFYIIIAWTVLYTFIVAVMDSQGFDNLWVAVILLLFFAFTNIGLGLRMTFRFSPKYVEIGRKHTEEIMNVVPFYLVLAMGAVFAYSLDMFTGVADTVIYIGAGLMTLYVIVSYLTLYIVLSPTSIKGRSLYTLKTVELQYQEITEVKLLKGRNALLLANQEKKIYIDFTIVDIKLILNEISKNVNEDIFKEAYLELKDYFISLGSKENIDEMDYFKGENNA